MLNLGEADMDTRPAMGSMVFTVVAAMTQMEPEIERERITGSVAKCWAADKRPGRAAPDLRRLPVS